MLSDFKKAFIKDEYKTTFSKSVLESLGDKLPDGFKYVQISKEAYEQIYNNAEKKIKVDTQLPKDFKPESYEELMEYIYRAQIDVEVPANSIAINEYRFKPSELIEFPVDEIEMKNHECRFVIKAQPFPSPFQIEIEGDGIKKGIYVQRKPLADMHKSLFESVEKSILSVSYIIDEVNHGLDISLNLNLENASSIEEIVEASKLYNAFLKGKIRISGIEITGQSNDLKEKTFLKILEFWQKVALLGERMKVRFQPKISIEKEEFDWIERLYKSIIDEEQYKEYIKAKDITITTLEKIDIDYIKLQKGLTFQFGKEDNIEILDTKLKFYSIYSWFDFKVCEVILIDENPFIYKFTIKPVNHRGIYRLVRHFINEEEAEEYRTKNSLSAQKLVNTQLTDLNK